MEHADVSCIKDATSDEWNGKKDDDDKKKMEEFININEWICM